MNATFPGSEIGDLDINRTGRIRRVHAVRVVWRQLCGFVAGLVAIGVWGSFGAYSDNGFFTLFAVAVAALTLYRFGRLAHDVLMARVNFREGAVRKLLKSDDDSVLYYLQIGDRNLRVTKAGFDAVDKRSEWRVYYLPKTGWVVNCERAVNLHMNIENVLESNKCLKASSRV